MYNDEWRAAYESGRQEALVTAVEQEILADELNREDCLAMIDILRNNPPRLVESISASLIALTEWLGEMHGYLELIEAFEV
jgi:hypothetical protein